MCGIVILGLFKLILYKRLIIWNGDCYASLVVEDAMPECPRGVPWNPRILISLSSGETRAHVF